MERGGLGCVFKVELTGLLEEMMEEVREREWKRGGMWNGDWAGGEQCSLKRVRFGIRWEG